MVYQGKQIILHLGVCANYFYYWFVDTTCRLTASSSFLYPQKEVRTHIPRGMWHKNKGLMFDCRCCWCQMLGMTSIFTWVICWRALNGLVFLCTFAVRALSRGSWLPLWLAYWTYLCLSPDVMFLRRSQEMWRTLGGFLRCVGFLQG